MRITRNLLLVLALLSLVTGSALAQAGRRPTRTDRPAGVDVGDPAPDLLLVDPAGKKVPLASLWAERPLVLVFGSYSSPEFRASAPEILRLLQVFPDTAAFAVVYSVEAHPAGADGPYGPSPEAAKENTRAGVEVPPATSLDARRAIAGRTQREFELFSPVTLLVDGMDDAASKAYGPSPNPAFLIDRGFVVARQVRFDPAAMESTLGLVLQARGAAADAPKGPEAP